MAHTTPHASVPCSEQSSTATRAYASPVQSVDPRCTSPKGAGDPPVQVRMAEGAPEVAAASKIRLGKDGNAGT